MVLYYNSACGPRCNTAVEDYAMVAKRLVAFGGRIRFASLNCDENLLMCASQQITRLAHFPTIISYRSGDIIFNSRKVGHRDQDLLLADLYHLSNAEFNQPLTIQIFNTTDDVDPVLPPVRVEKN